MPAYLSTSRIYYIAMYWHGDVPVGGQVGRSAGRQVCVYAAGLLSMPDMEYLFCRGGSGGLAPQASSNDRATTKRWR